MCIRDSPHAGSHSHVPGAPGSCPAYSTRLLQSESRILSGRGYGRLPRTVREPVSYTHLLMADLKAVYAAVDEQAALDALDAFGERWEMCIRDSDYLHCAG